MPAISLEKDFVKKKFVILPSEQARKTIIVDRDSQDIGYDGETSILRSKLSEQSRKFEVEIQKNKGCAELRGTEKNCCYHSNQ